MCFKGLTLEPRVAGPLQYEESLPRFGVGCMVSIHSNSSLEIRVSRFDRLNNVC